MPSNAQISGATIPMKVAGKVYQAKPLTDKDYDELTAWVRFKFIEESKAAIDSMALNSDERREMLTSMMLASARVTFNSAEGSRISNETNEGFARVGWQMLKAQHPQVIFEDFFKLFDEDRENRLANLEEINRVFMELNIPQEEEDDDSGPQEGSDSEPKSDEV